MKGLTQTEVEAIREKFEKTAFALTQERNDFLVPQIIDMAKKGSWINLRPEYQRRLVWDVKKRSAFIESLLLNIPIPTLFLYERELSRYEVMDGQQRIAAVQDFYSNTYALSGLEKWPELNGLRHKDLPDVLKRGLDRRRLSATFVVLDSSKSKGPASEDAEDVRKIVFERLNTGGLHLNHQELRNCLYAGPFNQLLIDLAKSPLFRRTWEISAKPQWKTRGDKDLDLVDEKGNQNKIFSRMLDCEIVLRFFALLEKEHLRGSMRSILTIAWCAILG